MASEVILDLQQQRDALKSNIQDVDENIKKLTGRDPAESRRLSTNRRIPLKRNSFGRPGSNQPPEKRISIERRRWGTTALSTRTKNVDSGGQEEEDEKKPAVHSSVVATGKPIEAPKNPVVEDATIKSRNRRMFGLLVGTLKQFKKESQVKTVQESKREEKLIKVEEQVQKEKEDALNERKELYQTRRTKQQELNKLEFKLEMAELVVDIKAHYAKFNDLIQLKSTPRVFFKPASHNSKTKKMLEETKKSMKDSLEQRLKEIEMCVEEDVRTLSRSFSNGNRGPGKTARDPIVIDPIQSKRDLFAEDAEIDKREQESVQIIDDFSTSKPISVDDKKQDNTESKVDMDEEGSVKLVDMSEEASQDIIVGEQAADQRRVVSQNTYSVVDERVVELSNDISTDDNKENEGLTVSMVVEDDVNIYADMQQEVEMFQPDESEA